MVWVDTLYLGTWTLRVRVQMTYLGWVWELFTRLMFMGSRGFERD